MRQVDVYVPCKHGGITLCNGAHFDYMLSHGVNSDDYFMAFNFTALDDYVLCVPVSALWSINPQCHAFPISSGCMNAVSSVMADTDHFIKNIGFAL